MHANFFIRVIYNFFMDSPLKESGWRTIPQYTYKVLNIECKFHEFDPQEHRLLCWELKQLYVAVTRARKRLWLFDHDKRRPKPLMELLKHQHLIYSEKVGELGECGLAVESTTEEWDRRGKLFISLLPFPEAVYVLSKRYKCFVYKFLVSVLLTLIFREGVL